MDIAQLGTIVTFKSPTEVSLEVLRDGLEMSGFDKGMAKDLLPRNAFGRAARKMEDGRIIKKFDESDSEIRFQFTKEHIESTGIDYSAETTLTLDKKSGYIDSPDRAIVAMAEKEFAHQMGNRKSADVTRLIQKIFDDAKGDLIPLRENGGVYFVPSTHTELLEKIGGLLVMVGGQINRFEVNTASPLTSQSVGDSVKDHLKSLADSLRENINALGSESTAAATEKRHDEIVMLKAKLSGYRYLLGAAAKDVDTEIGEVEKLYTEKLLDI